MSDKLQDAVKLLRDYCGGIPLSNAIIYIINHDRYLEETINKLREENDNCKAQYQHWDKKYSEAIIKMREMEEENKRLKTEVDFYKEITPKRMNEWICERVYKQIEPLFNKEES